MTASTRFPSAVQMLALIASAKPRPVSSNALAAIVDANPAAVRRILGRLAAAGITAARLGKGGGAVLARPARKITMLDIYQAVEPPRVVARARAARPDSGAVGRHIAAAFDAAVEAPEAAFFAALEKITLKDIRRRTKSCGR